MAAGAFGCISSSSNLCNLRISRSKRERNEDFPNDIYKSYLQIQNSTIELDHAGFMSKSSKVDWALPVSKHSNGISLTAMINLWLMHLFQTWGKSQRTAAIFLPKRLKSDKIRSSETWQILINDDSINLSYNAVISLHWMVVQLNIMDLGKSKV